jgi:hypothetical protein
MNVGACIVALNDDTAGTKSMADAKRWKLIPWFMQPLAVWHNS